MQAIYQANINELTPSFINMIQKQFKDANVKIIINNDIKNNLDIEVITEDDPDYETILKCREERQKYPENYGTLDDIDWN
jgi:hypothetical protein